MPTLCEVTFEGIKKNEVIPMLGALTNKYKTLISFEINGNDLPIPADTNALTESLEPALNSKSDTSILLKLSKMRIADMNLHSIFLRLIKYNDTYDIDFTFDAEDPMHPEESIAMSKLHSYANEIASRYNMKSYFGGMEPSTDESTRYFTNKTAGPL